ncbi:hypothetical protein EMIT0P253_260029 [Pseudomonas sp. IT-P253]
MAGLFSYVRLGRQSPAIALGSLHLGLGAMPHFLMKKSFESGNQLYFAGSQAIDAPHYFQCSFAERISQQR